MALDPGKFKTFLNSSVKRGNPHVAPLTIVLARGGHATPRVHIGPATSHHITIAQLTPSYLVRICGFEQH